MFARSGILLRFDGTVTAIEVRREHQQGVDDVWLVSIDGQPVHLDPQLAGSLRVGDRIVKRRWDAIVLIDGESRELSPTTDARRMLLVAPVAVALTAAVALPGRRRVDASADGPEAASYPPDDAPTHGDAGADEP